MFTHLTVHKTRQPLLGQLILKIKLSMSEQQIIFFNFLILSLWKLGKYENVSKMKKFPV